MRKDKAAVFLFMLLFVFSSFSPTIFAVRFSRSLLSSGDENDSTQQLYDVDFQMDFITKQQQSSMEVPAPHFHVHSPSTSHSRNPQYGATSTVPVKPPKAWAVDFKRGRMDIETLDYNDAGANPKHTHPSPAPGPSPVPIRKSPPTCKRKPPSDSRKSNDARGSSARS
ncbi:hypothetical protein OROGR_032221 [Orobanche gracilis]